MKAVVQRAAHARVDSASGMLGEIGIGLVVLLGVGADDDEGDAEWLASKCAGLRVFEDEGGRMNLSLLDTGGGILVVSQFTLYGDCRKGRRPSFTRAAPSDVGERLYEHFVASLRREGFRVETGKFGAKMLVSIENDGPVTLLLDSKDRP